VPSLGGKILRVNLSSKKIAFESTLEYVKTFAGKERKFLGGKEINVWILFREVKPWVTPFDPANKLIYGVGPLVGTLAPAASRFSVESKNAFTNGFASSNCGSHFAPELKYAGYDNIVIEGRSARPVYLWINDDKVEIRDASGIWGKTTWDADSLIKEDVGDESIQIVSIGPAGENLVRSACIIADRGRAAGRCGLGAVMGSKNLKAIAVKGTSSVQVANQELFMKNVDNCYKKIEKSLYARLIKKYGTHLDSYAIFSNKENSSLDFKNFQDDYWDPEKAGKLGMELYHKEFETAGLACFSCPIGCSHFYKIREGPYAGSTCEGFEGNDISNFGANFDITYPPAIIKAHALCSQYGLDQDNASRVIAWAFECYQKGILSRKDTDGIEFSWGDHELLMKMLHKVAFREGIGDILAEGCKRASEIIGRGSEKYCMHIKGQDLYETMRISKGWALGVAIAARGGGHTTGSIQTGNMRFPSDFCDKIWGVENAGNPVTYRGKARIVVYIENLTAACDSLGMCFFTSIRNDPAGLTPDDYASLFSAATGLETTGTELMLLGERIRNLEKAFNTLHAGFNRRDDYPPQRFMEEPVKSGPYKGELLEKDKWDKMLDEYYKLHDWDLETGLQTKKGLRSLGLEEILAELKRASRQKPLGRWWQPQ
jgi:aldehyde:ferredoxin oxidoreductase